MNSPWTRDVASSGFQWAYDNRNYLNNLADRMYLNKYRSYQKKTAYYKQLARSRGGRRLMDISPQRYQRVPPLLTPSRVAEKRAKFNPIRFGDAPSTASNRREAVMTDVFGALSRNLYQYLMTDIPLTAVNDDILRRGSSIYVTGCDINVGIRNLQGCPLFVNIALVVPTGSNIVNTQNFFANDGTVSNQRYIDFQPTARTARQLHYANINSQQYVVLHHHREELSSNGSTSSAAAAVGEGGTSGTCCQPDWFIYKKYLPVRRVITYDDNTGASATAPIWFCIWVDRWDAPAGGTPVTNAAEMYIHNTTYFKDTLSMGAF